MKYLLLIIGLMLSLDGTAQQIDRQVIGSSGDHFENSTMQLYFTVGELMTETYLVSSPASGEVGVLNQGFHQPQDDAGDVVSVDNNLFPNTQASLFPNPTTGPVSVVLTGEIPADMEIEVLDPTGRQLLARSYSFPSGNRAEMGCDLSGLAAGTYFLRLSHPSGSTLSTFTLQKH